MNLYKETKNKELQGGLETILNCIRLSGNRDTGKISIRPIEGEYVERQNFENGSSIVYKDKDGFLNKVIDVDLDGNVQRLRTFSSGTLVEAIGFDIEGDMNQLAIWENGILSSLYNFRKDKTIENKAQLVGIQDVEKSLAVYETMIFDEKGNCIEKYRETEELVYSEDMNVWLLKG